MYMTDVSGYLVDYKNGRHLPQVLKAMTEALKKESKLGTEDFLQINFEEMGGDEDSYFIKFTSVVKVTAWLQNGKFFSGEVILRGRVHFNHPDDCTSVSFEGAPFGVSF